MRHSLSHVAWVALVATVFPGSARGDIVTPGQKKITVVIDVDLGEYAGVAFLEHEVKEGETLSGIATERLGDATRLPELLAVNPDLKDPDTLAVGDKLLIPPRKKVGERYHFFAQTLLRDDAVRLSTSGRLPRHHYGHVLHAVKDGHVAEYKKLLADPEWSRKPSEETPWLYVSGTFSTTESVSSFRWRKSSHARYRLMSLADGEMEFELVSKKAGDGDESESEREPRKAQLGLAGLAAAAFAVLLWRRRTRIAA